MASRGDIYWAMLPLALGSVQQGHRPVLIVQNDAGNRSSPTTIVVPITSQPRQRPYPFHVPLSAQESGLRVDGLILCEQIQTVPQRSLETHVSSLSPGKMREVDDALLRSLGIER